MGVAFRELPGGRSRWRLPQSRDRGLQGSTHCGYCVHGTHLLPIDHDHWNASTPATRCAIGAADGIQVITTPVQAPNANAFAERWVRTVRQECLDWVLVWGRRHLERVLAEYVRHYNDQRPHRGVALRPPRSIHSESSAGAAPLARTVRRRDRLGGLIHEYYQAAA